MQIGKAAFNGVNTLVLGKYSWEFDSLFRHIMTRLEINFRIVKCLSEIIGRYPDLRFGQILSNIGMPEDPFYEEPSVTLKRLETWLENNS